MDFKWEDYSEISDIVANGNEKEIRDKVFQLAKKQDIKTKKLVNLQDDDGNTLLHLAAEKGVESSVKAILSLGGNPETVNKEGQTPLDLAKKGGEEFFESVKYQIDDNKLNKAIRGRSLKVIESKELNNNKAAQLFKTNLTIQDAEGESPKSPNSTPTSSRKSISKGSKGL